METKNKQRLNRIAGIVISLAGLVSIGTGAAKSFAITSAEKPAIMRTFYDLEGDIQKYRDFSGNFSPIDSNSVDKKISKYNQSLSNKGSLEELESYRSKNKVERGKMAGFLLGGFGLGACGAVKYLRNKKD